MKLNTLFKSITALTILTLALTGPAIGRDQNKMTHIWTQFEKELGLQNTYSVDMEMNTLGINMNVKAYHHKGKSRTEMTMPMIGIKMATLELPDSAERSIILFPDQKRYVVNTDADDADNIDRDTFSLKNMGRETFEGVNCIKKRLTVNDGNGETHTMDILFSPKVKNMPVKITALIAIPTDEGDDKQQIASEILFKNYNFATPAASLFAIPSGYTKADSMEEAVMAGMFQGGGIADLLKNLPAEGVEIPDIPNIPNIPIPPAAEKPAPANPARLNLRKGILNVLRHALED